MTLARTCRALCLALILVSGLQPALAADPPDCANPKADEIARCFGVDTSIPASPGLSIVGLSDSDAVAPTTPRELGAAIVNGLGADGKPKAGLAIDFAPAKLLAPMTKRHDLDDPLTRLLWNTQLSLGVGKNSDEKDKSQSVGIGLHVILWMPEKDDPLRSRQHAECMTNALKASAKAAAPVPPTAASAGAVAAPAAEGTKTIADCYKAQNERSRNVSSVSLSLAQARLSKDGSWSGYARGPSALWLSANYAFDHLPSMSLRSRLSLVGLLKRTTHEAVGDPLNADKKVEQASTTTALKLLYRGDKSSLHFERSLTRAKLDGYDRQNIRRNVLGFDYQINSGMWLVAAVGGESGRLTADGKSFVQTGLRFGSATSSLFGAGS